MSVNLLQSSIANVHRLLLRGTITANKLYQLSLERIGQIADLNAYISCSDCAVKDAESSTKRFAEGKPLSMLDGIPFSVKDNFCTKQFKTTSGSKMLADYSPPFNATVIERLHENGGLLMGKTNLDDFAIGCATIHSAFGPCKNPWGLDKVASRSNWYVPGGSSGGSAVAVATGSVFASLGSDTGGSTRNPAAHVGVVGFKPSYGVISRFGLLPLANSMDNVGILTRYVGDAELVFDILRGRDNNDLTSVDRSYVDRLKAKHLCEYTIGIPIEYNLPGMSESIKSAWDNVADYLGSIGMKIRRVSLPHTEYITSTYAVINCSEVASNFSCYDGIRYGHRHLDESLQFADYLKSTREVLGEVVKDRVFAGNYFLLSENNSIYARALRLRRLITEDFTNAFKKVDILLTPVTHAETKLYSEWVSLTMSSPKDTDDDDNAAQALLEDTLTQGANLAGLPAISVPVGLTDNNLPIGIQCIGNRYGDKSVLRVAKAIEDFAKWDGLPIESAEVVLSGD